MRSGPQPTTEMSNDNEPQKDQLVNQLFTFQTHKIRVQGTPDNPLFVASDVCAVLEISDVRQAFDRLDEDERGGCSIPTPGGIQEVRAVTESGLYNLILGSRNPSAKVFKRWVTHEVLPAIRKTGKYEVAPVPTADISTALSNPASLRG